MSLEEQQADSTTPPKTSPFHEVLIAYVAVVCSIAATAHLLPGVAQEYVYSVILAAMVYLPIARADRRRMPLSVYGITLEGWKAALLTALVAMAIIFPLFVIGNYFVQTELLQRNLTFSLPDKNLAWLWIEQTLFIALPEEFFYRGWMQKVFEEKWPSERRLFGGKIGLAAVLTSLLFAIGHLAAIPAPFRLLVFFPSLLFCWLRNRTDSVMAPILVHGLANVLQAIIVASYF